MISSHGRRNPLLEVAIVAAIASASAFPLLAQAIKQPVSSLDRLAFAKRELRISQTLVDADTIKGLISNRQDIDRFRAEHGADWRFVVDKRIGHVNLLEGGAIPFIPGPANNLKSENGACMTASCVPPEKIVSLARDFLARNRGVLQINPEELVPDPAGVTPVGNSIYFVRFQWVHGGVPVEGGSVFLAINNGNLIQVGVQDIGTIKLDPKPTIPAERAWQILRSYVGGMSDKDVILNGGTLSIIPITRKGLDPDSAKMPFGKMIDYALVYKLVFRRPGVSGTWEGTVDAHTGELLRFRDINVYGHIQGGVYKTDAPQVEVNVPFPFADHGVGMYANASGDFPGIVGTSTLTGQFVRMTDNCGAISLPADGAGVVNFGTSGGTDCTTPGSGGAGNTHAARTQYWNVTEIKMKAMTYLPANVWLQGQLQDIIDINQACNAYWDPVALNLNFFRTGTANFGPFNQTCGNTGELPGVSLHEWGHGMDSNDGSGIGTDNVPVESRADWTALLQTHQSCTGNGFATARAPMPAYGLNCGGYGNPCSGCTGIRDADFAQHTTATAWTPQNKGTVWGTANCGGGFYNGPCGWEDHCESGVATQALWDFVNRDLVGAPTNLDLVTAWQLEDRLFYTGMPQSTNMYTCTVGMPTTSNGCGAGSLYTVMRAIDDDGDGVGNGTPHAAAIFKALNRHGIACGVTGDATNQNHTSCPALATPTLTATTGSSQVTLNWTDGGMNAIRYFIYRNETGCNAGFTKIATVVAPMLTYTDTTVVHGLTYYYSVQAATANDSCVSPMSNCTAVVAQLPADSDFYVRDWTENPGSHDNGEEPSTHFTTNWAYSSDVWNRGTNTAGTPNASDWYPTDNLYAGLGALGDNYGFVRVHRNGSGSAVPVTAEFLISPFGAGSNFTSVASTVLNFAAADQVLVQGATYHQDPTASTHACIAVQISTADDPIKLPHLAGHSPGDPDGQAIILLDNNKAQRNLGVSHDVVHFSGLHYALIHNPSLLPRDIRIRIESPAAEGLQGAQIQVVGGRTAEFRQGAEMVLEGMQPGENRWIALKAAVDKEAPVHFYVKDGERVVNGFSLLLQPVAVTEAIRDNLRNHVQVFNRLAAAFGADAARNEAMAAARLLDQKEIGSAEYLGFLRQHVKPMTATVEPLLKKSGTSDLFSIAESMKALSDTANRKQLEQAAAEHGILLNRLDSFATMLQKSEGDPADILQIVRWQEQLYRTRPALGRVDCSAAVVKLSQEFIRRWDSGQPQAYPDFLHQLSDCFRSTAGTLQNQRLAAAAAAIERQVSSLAALEKAHREFLLALQDATGAQK
jgi:hypothetical protein